MSAITVSEMKTQLERGLTASKANTLAERLRARVGAEALANGSAQFVDELEVGWVIVAPGASAPPVVVAELGSDFRLPMQPLGDTGLFVATARWAAGSAVRWYFDVDGVRVGGGQTETYPMHPDSRARTDIPKGRLVIPAPWRSRVFAGTVREW